MFVKNHSSFQCALMCYYITYLFSTSSGTLFWFHLFGVPGVTEVTSTLGSNHLHTSLLYSLVPHSSFLGVHCLVSSLHKPLPEALSGKPRLRQTLMLDLGGRSCSQFFFSIPLCSQLNHPLCASFKGSSALEVKQ